MGWEISITGDDQQINYIEPDGRPGVIMRLTQETDLHCPECDQLVLAVAPEISDSPPPWQYAVGVMAWDSPVVTSWQLALCFHSVSTREYELCFTTEPFNVEFRKREDHDHSNPVPPGP